MDLPIPNRTVAELRRKHAAMLLGLDANFFDVARAYGIAPRTLLAWLHYENSKWENDVYGPEEPDDPYTGEWPSREDEFGWYLRHAFRAEHFLDADLAQEYERYRAAVLDKLERRQKKKSV